MHALVVCAAEGGPSASVFDKPEAGYDMLIAVDGGAESCLRAGHTPSLVIGDMDSLSSRTLRALEDTSVRIVTYPADKDASDLDLALNEARSSGVTSVTVIGAWTGRLDHTLAAVGSLLRSADMSPSFLDEDFVGWVITSDADSRLELSGQGAVFSVLAVSSDATVTITGARYRVDRCMIDALSSFGVSNSVERRACITVHTGAVLVLSSSVGGIQHASRYTSR